MGPTPLKERKILNSKTNKNTTFRQPGSNPAPTQLCRPLSLLDYIP